MSLWIPLALTSSVLLCGCTSVRTITKTLQYSSAELPPIDACLVLASPEAFSTDGEKLLTSDYAGSFAEALRSRGIRTELAATEVSPTELRDAALIKAHESGFQWAIAICYDGHKHPRFGTGMSSIRITFFSPLALAPAASYQVVVEFRSFDKKKQHYLTAVQAIDTFLDSANRLRKT